MLLNVLIVLFILVLAYWTGLQGLFSGVLHLGLVIVSGALAFAFWEPVAYGMLEGMMPRYALAVGLIVPFCFILLISRFVFDHYLPKNMEFSSLTNLLGGGSCGALAAVLSMGILMIGFAYLPTGRTTFGIQEWQVDTATGKIVPAADGQSLWVPVDTITASFFSTLSEGSFYPSNDHPLGLFRSDLVKQAAIVRLTPEGDVPTVATTQGVTVDNFHVLTAPEHKQQLPEVFKTELDPNIAGALTNTTDQLYVVSTGWKVENGEGIYNTDGKLLVPPTQIRLMEVADGKTELIAPFAFSTKSNAQDYEFTVVGAKKPGNDHLMASSNVKPTNITWAFIVPSGIKPQYLVARNLRIELPQTPQPETPKMETVVQLIGSAMAKRDDTVATTGTGGTGGNGGNTGQVVGPKSGVFAEKVELTARIPEPFSRNKSTNLVIGDDLKVRDRQETIEPRNGPISRKNTVAELWAPDDRTMVRALMKRDNIHSILGNAKASAVALNPLFISDNNGDKWQPIAYVWKTADRTQTILVTRGQPIRSVSLLPYKKMGKDDELYVYFLVNKKTRLNWIGTRATNKQDLNQISVPE